MSLQRLLTTTTFPRRTALIARKEQSIELLSGCQAGISQEDLLRELIQRTVQQVLEAEMSSFLGAES